MVTITEIKKLIDFLTSFLTINGTYFSQPCVFVIATLMKAPGYNCAFRLHFHLLNSFLRL